MTKAIYMEVNGRKFKIYLSIFSSFGLDCNIYEIKKRKLFPGYREVFFDNNLSIIKSTDIRNIKEEISAIIKAKISLDEEAKKIREEFEKIS